MFSQMVLLHYILCPVWWFYLFLYSPCIYIYFFCFLPSSLSVPCQFSSASFCIAGKKLSPSGRLLSNINPKLKISITKPSLHVSYVWGTPDSLPFPAFDFPFSNVFCILTVCKPFRFCILLPECTDLRRLTPFALENSILFRVYSCRPSTSQLWSILRFRRSRFMNFNILYGPLWKKNRRRLGAARARVCLSANRLSRCLSSFTQMLSRDSIQKCALRTLPV